MLLSSLLSIGLSPGAARAKAALFERAANVLDGSVGSRGQRLRLFVPGRIEVLGKHTDYAGGRSLLCAAERGVCLVACRRDDNEIHVTDVVSNDRVVTALDADNRALPAGWGVYVATVAHRLARNFRTARRGVEVAFASDLPAAAGMSSSSALLTSVMLALSWANELPGTDEYKANILTSEDLAEYLGTVENGQDFRDLRGDAGVGTFGGSEDHTAMLCCRAGELSRYRFCPVIKEGQVPMPAGHRFVVGASGVVAEKTGAQRDTYNRASLASRAVLRAWNAASGRHDATLAAAIEQTEDAPRLMREVLQRGDVTGEGNGQFQRAALVERFEQFYEETFVIIPRVCDLLSAGRVDGIGDLVDRSQRGAERGLRNQVPETVFLAESARGLGALAASAFGAGFGGSVWALVADAEIEPFCSHWAERYRAAFPQHASRAQFFSTAAGPAATSRIAP